MKPTGQRKNNATDDSLQNARSAFRNRLNNQESTNAFYNQSTSRENVYNQEMESFSSGNRYCVKVFEVSSSDQQKIRDIFGLMGNLKDVKMNDGCAEVEYKTLESAEKIYFKLRERMHLILITSEEVDDDGVQERIEEEAEGKMEERIEEVQVQVGEAEAERDEEVKEEKEEEPKKQNKEERVKVGVGDYDTEVEHHVEEENLLINHEIIECTCAS